MKKYLFILTFGVISLCANATIPNGYYNAIEGKSGDAILSALYSTINNHTNVGYDGLYSVYPTSDLTEDGKVWDMYSTCTWNHGQKKCGSYSDVCDCYNREHSVPQSWFNEASPMKSDAFHVYPTDGKVNGQRSNFPFGECEGGTYLNSRALGRLGTSTFAGYSGKVFEPDDEYKGDFARTYFYMVSCYLKTNFTQATGGSVAFKYSNGQCNLTDYSIRLFLKWHREDPVSQKELDRNEAVYNHQHNRNPFIDYPCLAEYIWGNHKGQSVKLQDLIDCAGGIDIIDTTSIDTTIIENGFRLLPVSNIHAHSATLNWTDAHVSGYTVDVYTRTESEGGEEVTILDDIAGAKAEQDGYCDDTEEANGIRLGSGKSTGSLTYNLPELTETGVVTIIAKCYKTDDASFRVTIGDTKQVFKTSESYEEFTMEIPQGSKGDLVIETIEKGLRIYVNRVSVVCGGESTTISHVLGYPKEVGNVFSHTVENLTENEEYFYTVKPAGYEAEEDVFYTEEGWNGVGFETIPSLDYRVTSNGIELFGLPENAEVNIYNLFGQQVTDTRAEGIYLVQVIANGEERVLKIRVN